ncbi:phytanoyl-CoA dioxygenase family protein [Myxococcota bacterium]|nr:phytanoyl-CoA dioxygenase family protein [Myxococcota bacterium]
MLDTSELDAWHRDGFFLRKGFTAPDVCDAMHRRIIELSRLAERGEPITPAFVQTESRLADSEGPAESRVSKLFRVHRQERVFRDFCVAPATLEIVRELLADDLDCFLSQFIFKHPGALGQPWHQDAFYFPFDRSPQVGVWLAITHARLESGPLWVLPGSHREPIHDAVADRRPDANLGYVEIVDHDMSDAVPVVLEPGDCLFFHSHLMHCSTDNESMHMRAAMVFHYSEGGTRDGTEERFGFKSPNNDFLPVLRSGRTIHENERA